MRKNPIPLVSEVLGLETDELNVLKIVLTHVVRSQLGYYYFFFFFFFLLAEPDSMQDVSSPTRD